jgi:hypothetical protein
MTKKNINTSVVCPKTAKRISFEDRIHLSWEENTKHYSLEKHVCDTCKEEIHDISRVLIMRDKDGGPRLLCFHYFFPCWDMQLLCQQYPNLIIDMVRFSIPENISMKESSIKDIQENIEMWI